MRSDSPSAFGVLAIWLLAFLALVAAVSLAHGFRGAFGDFAPLAGAGRDLRSNSGDAVVSGAAIDIRNTRPAPPTVLQLPLRPFQASHLARLRVEADAVPRDVEIAVLWIRRTEPGKIQEQRLELDHDRHVAVTLLDRNPDWRGEIAMVALGVKGMSSDAWRVARIALEPVGPVAIARGVADDWSAFGKWDGRSINVAFGGRETQRIYLPILAFLASAIALLVLHLLYRRRGAALPASVIVLPFVIGWIAVDLRWSAELTSKARDTWRSFAGRTLDERHLAMDDADLYRTIGLARSRLPGAPERIFINSDFDYFRMRAAYLFYPHNVLPFGWYDGKSLKPGDLVFLYQKADVRFDATNSALIWADGSRSAVSPILAQTGAGLFRIR